MIGNGTAMNMESALSLLRPPAPHHTHHPRRVVCPALAGNLRHHSLTRGPCDMHLFVIKFNLIMF